jgi:putative molybdopterin biosynthesis protein
VLADDADAGLGLRATADRLDLGFVPVGTETVRVLVNPERATKSGVEALESALAAGDDVFASLPGYEPVQ